MDKNNIKELKYENFENKINSIDIILEKLNEKLNKTLDINRNLNLDSIDVINNKLKDNINEKNNYNKKILEIKNNNIICEKNDENEENIKTLYNNKISEEEINIINKENIIKSIIKGNVKYCDYMDKLNFNKKCKECLNNKNIIEDIKKNNSDKDNTEQLKILEKEVEDCKKNIFKYKLKIEEEIHNMKINKIRQEQNELNIILKKDIMDKVKTLDENIRLLTIDKDNYYLTLENKEIQDEIYLKLKEREDIVKMKYKFEEYKKMNEDRDKLETIINNIYKKKSYLKTKIIMRDELNKSMGEIFAIKKINDEKKEILINIQDEYNTIIKIIDLYDKYEMMDYILNKYIIQLEQIINNILMTIVNYKIKIIQENTELRIFKIEDKIMINTRQLSGNEKFVINIALKCALNKMAVSYKSNFIIIDEGFGSFDSEKLNKITELFDIIKKEFEMCIIISHIEKIKNMNNKMLKVKRDEGGYSKII